MARPVIRFIPWVILGLVLTGYLSFVGWFWFSQDTVIYHPSHKPTPPTLSPWTVDGQLYGFFRPASVPPKAIWLVLQGNGGQAGNRGYFRNVPADEAIYLLEYPGYGLREGPPSGSRINLAASAAYRELRRRFPDLPVGVVGESFGSGPASLLARELVPPDCIVLIVPLARLDITLNRFLRVLPIRLLLRDNWDNIAALRDYRGPLTVYAADKDTAIPRRETLLLTDNVPAAKLVWLDADHNHAAERPEVKLVR